jgi:hypothetical protein
LHTFITTYQSFTTPHKLFEKLLQRYHVPEGRVEEKMKEAIRLRYHSHPPLPPSTPWAG